MGTKLKTKQRGFTIIEVSIVLAIAGLIMAIVFLAIPTLERNTRNTQRTSDATHLAGLVSDFQANHNGTLPTGIGAGGTQVDIAGEKFNQFTTNPAATLVTVAAGNVGVSYGTTTQGAINDHGSCDRSTGTITYTANNHFAVGYTIETSNSTQTVCVDGS